MNSFTYRYPVTVYFGEKAAEKNLPAQLKKVGKNVMLAYGGGSIKKNGVYEELTGILKAAGKTVTEFTGIMSNPTFAKVQEGAKLARNNKIDLVLAVGGGSVIDCCKIVCAQAVTEGKSVGPGDGPAQGPRRRAHPPGGGGHCLWHRGGDERRGSHHQ